MAALFNSTHKTTLRKHPGGKLKGKTRSWCQTTLRHKYSFILLRLAGEPLPGPEEEPDPIRDGGVDFLFHVWLMQMGKQVFPLWNQTTSSTKLSQSCWKFSTTLWAAKSFIKEITSLTQWFPDLGVGTPPWGMKVNLRGCMSEWGGKYE